MVPRVATIKLNFQPISRIAFQHCYQYHLSSHHFTHSNTYSKWFFTVLYPSADAYDDDGYDVDIHDSDNTVITNLYVPHQDILAKPFP